MYHRQPSCQLISEMESNFRVCFEKVSPYMLDDQSNAGSLISGAQDAPFGLLGLLPVALQGQLTINISFRVLTIDKSTFEKLRFNAHGLKNGTIYSFPTLWPMCSVNPCQHPIVILKDVPFEDLRAVVQFMYNGVVNVSAEKLTAVLKVRQAI